MTYQETVSYLYAQLPAFQKIGKKAITPSLDNIKAFCRYLGEPQNKFKSIHVAGTNGKGSSCHMLASILQESGYKVGLYTSPHLKDFRERFRVNGKLVEEQLIVSFVEKHKEFIKNLNPSFFEVTVALAFDVFAKEEVDFAVIETGLGGRLDSTNVINPIVSLITNVGFDHMDVLGNTLPEIAREKGGIIKPCIPVVISERDNETDQVFIELAKERSSPITFAQDVYMITGAIPDTKSTKYLVDNKGTAGESFYELDLQGTYQSNNLLGVLSVARILRNHNAININTVNIFNGLKKTITNTDLKGRWQTLGFSPLIIADTGHNEHAFKLLDSHISKYSDSNCHLILGFASDKKLDGILGLLPSGGKYYFSTFDSPRSKTKEELKTIATNFNISDVAFFRNVNVALAFAKQQATKDDLIFIGGSTYLVAELDNL
ncbi:MAG: dihydrofolate synthase/folylpolyglutamate synthase [Arcticibacterium sp.]|jgi:dihydrofolate synthase/folylpolyglutamate synthase